MTPVLEGPATPFVAGHDVPFRGVPERQPVPRPGPRGIDVPRARAMVGTVLRFRGFVVTIELVDRTGARRIHGIPQDALRALAATDVDATITSFTSALGDLHRPGWHHG